MKWVTCRIRQRPSVADADGMNSALELFTDAELAGEAGHSHSQADTLPLALAEPLRLLAGSLLTELARRRIAQREQSP